jgi:hypothetical protein
MYHFFENLLSTKKVGFSANEQSELLFKKYLFIRGEKCLETEEIAEFTNRELDIPWITLSSSLIFSFTHFAHPDIHHHKISPGSIKHHRQAKQELQLLQEKED